MKKQIKNAIEEIKEEKFNEWASGEGREKYEDLTNGVDPRDCY